MQDQDNAKIVQSMYAAFAKGDIAAIMERVAPEIEWTMEGPASIPLAGRRKGHDQVRKFFQEMATTQTEHKLTIDDIVAQGDTVMSTGRFAARVNATGKRIDCAVAHIFKFRAGKVVKFLDIVDTAQMVEAYTASRSAAG
jgi:ketosteroid isomerase-like protein